MSGLNVFHRLCCLAAMLSALAVSVGTVRADTPTVVGDPANPSTLGKAVQDAYASGARDIVVRKGIYILPTATGDFVLMDGWKDVVVSGYGATIISAGRDWPDSIFHLRNCNNVTVAGFLLSQNTVTAYQGKVLSVDSGDGSPGAYSCTWSPDAGYPTLDPSTTKISCFNVVDGKTRQLKVGTADFYNVPCQNIGNSRFKITGSNPNAHNIAVGDWLVMRYDGHPTINKVHLDSCRNCTIRDVSMMRNGFAAIFETGGPGGNHILGCKWLLGPKPAGATEDPVVSCSADGFHSGGTVTGPDIENCVMEGPMLDDCIAIHGYFSDVVSATPDSLTIKGNGSWDFAPGEPMIICSSGGFYAEAKVTTVTNNADNTRTVNLDSNVNAPTSGTKVYDPDRCGAGYKIIDCKIGHTRSRAIIVKADNGLIEGNTIDGSQMTAVCIGPEFWWNEAGYAHHVTVAHNTIIHCGGACGDLPAVQIHGDGAIGNSDITVQDNVLVGNYMGDFQASWAKNVTISGNKVVGCNPLPTVVAPPNLVQVDNDQGVTIEGNTVKNASVYKSPLVVVGNNVTGLSNDIGSDVAAR
jgi:hypothetical protein